MKGAAIFTSRRSIGVCVGNGRGHARPGRRRETRHGRAGGIALVSENEGQTADLACMRATMTTQQQMSPAIEPFEPRETALELVESQPDRAAAREHLMSPLRQATYLPGNGEAVRELGRA